MVEAGLTDTDPPFADMVRLLPLLPLSVTCVAFLTDTVTTEEVPLAIDLGLAVIEPVGAGELDVDSTAWPATPANAGTAHGRSIARM